MQCGTDGSGIATSPELATNLGWDPIGTPGELFAFSARFNGNGNTIFNLYVRRSGNLGLFGVSIGTLDGIGIVDARLYGGGEDDSIGGLVGQSGGFGTSGFLPGTVINSYATGDVSGAESADRVGSLVGFSSGPITASYGFGTVTRGGRSTLAVTRSGDTSPTRTVPKACSITPENSSATGTDWVAAQWDFGTATERPVVLHNGNQVPGQTPRTCS